jgi:hypothetical protein
MPARLQQLIADMAAANRTWGEERIAAELRLKLGLTVSARTVRRYMPRRAPVGPSTQSWATFLRNAGAVLACDFFVVVTASFQRVCVFVILDIATRQMVHWNLTRHPKTEWAIQQFRMAFRSTDPIASSCTIATASSGSPMTIRWVACRCAY